jgi:hypothetical protein
MINVKAIVKENTLAIAQLLQGWAYIHNNEVLVGIPAENSGGHGGVSNVELLYIHSNGSPANNIPARPTLEPGVDDPKARPVLQTLLGDAMKAAITGNIAGAKMSQEKAGVLATNSVKAVFGSGRLAPLKLSTIRRRKKHSAAPLVDTGALRNAITYVIRPKG